MNLQKFAKIYFLVCNLIFVNLFHYRLTKAEVKCLKMYVEKSKNFCTSLTTCGILVASLASKTTPTRPVNVTASVARFLAEKVFSLLLTL